MSAEQYRLIFASGNAHLSNVVFDAFVTAGRGRVEARLVSALAQARVFATRAPCDVVLLDASLGWNELLVVIGELRGERPDLLIGVLLASPSGSQRAALANAGAKLVTAPPDSLEQTEALLVQVISALQALRAPVLPKVAPPAPAPAPAAAPPPQQPIRRSGDSPLFATPKPSPGAPAAQPVQNRDGQLFAAPTPPVRRSGDVPLFGGSAPTPPASPTAAKPSGTRTISLPVARPFAAPEPAPPTPPTPPQPPPVAPPAPAPATEPEPKPRSAGFRFTQLIKNIKPVSMPKKPEGET